MLRISARRTCASARVSTIIALMAACALVLAACGGGGKGVVDWAVGPVKFTLDSTGDIEVSGQKTFVTPIGTFSLGEKFDNDASDAEIILVVRHRTRNGIVDDAYRVPTSSDVRIIVNGTTQLGIRGRTVTLDASKGDIREIALTGVTWLMPDLRGSGLQEAQGRLEEMSDGALDYRSVYDAKGRGRSVRFDMGWTVCTQSVPAGRTVSSDTAIGLGVVGRGESCPENGPTPSEAVWRMPALIGTDLESAREQLSDLSADELQTVNTHDATAQDRGPTFDSNWKICSQRPVPNSTITAATPIEFGVVETEEACPAVAY